MLRASICLTPVLIAIAASGAVDRGIAFVTQTRPDTVVRMAGEPRYPGLAGVTAELTIGMVEGPDEYLLDNIRMVLPAMDGSLWVTYGGIPSTGTRKLVVFDSAGRFVRRVGTTGNGPGESQLPHAIAQFPDGRIVVRDDMLANRLNVFTPDGRVSATWTFSGAYSRGPQNFPLVADTSSILWLQFVASRFGPAGASGYVRIDARGRVIDTVSQPRLPNVTPAGMVIQPPFWPRVGAVTNPHGFVATYESSRYAIDLLIPPRTPARARPSVWRVGDPVTSIRRAVEPVRLTDAEYRDQRAYLDELWQHNGDVPRVGDVRRVKPPIRAVYAGGDGRLWVHVSVPSERYVPRRTVTSGTNRTRPTIGWREPIVFDVFESDGRYVGRVEFPHEVVGFRAFLGDKAWAVVALEDGVPAIRRYRARWRG